MSKSDAVVGRADLDKALKLALKFVAQRSTLPVLANVLLSAGPDGCLWVAGTNLENWVRVKVDATVTRPFEITAPAKTIADVVAAMPGDTVDLTVEAKKVETVLAGGGVKSRIKGIDPQEFPLVEAQDGESAPDLTLAGSVLRRLVRAVAFAAATDDARPTLTGLHLEVSETDVTLTASDGFAVATASHAFLNATAPAGYRAVVPARLLLEASEALAGETVTLHLAEESLRLSGERIRMGGQLLQGKFPDWRGILPKAWATEVTVNRAALADRLTTARVFARENQKIVKLSFAKESMRVLGQAAETGEALAELAADEQDGYRLTGPGLEVALNVEFALEHLKAAPDQEVVIRLNTPTTPVGFYRPDNDNERQFGLVMPITPEKSR